MSIDQHPSIGPQPHDIPPAIVREVRAPKSWLERLDDLMEAMEAFVKATPPKAEPSLHPALLRPRQIAAYWELYEPPVTAAHPAFLRPRRIAPLAFRH